jgi:hypothetical protein
LVFAAAFPLSNNVDERFHLMTTRMYAQGQIPGRELPHMDPEFARTFLLYWSPEYGAALESSHFKGPVYQLPTQELETVLAQKSYKDKLEQWLRRPNYEAQSAPLYYLVTAVWYRLGATLGMKDWSLMYWIRFLNPLVYSLLVWISYRFVRQVYPTRTFLWISVPTLIAVFPQDVFVGANRDVLSAPISAAVLLFLLWATEGGPNQNRFLLASSLLTGLAFLVNVSNFVLYGALVAAVWVWHRRSVHLTKQKVAIASACALAAGGLPLLWMSRNYLVFGDLTGSRAKIHELSWTVRAFPEFFDHPIFSSAGARYFVSSLIRSFWRGEYTWHGHPMQSVWTDRFYLWSSVLFIGIFLVDFVLRKKSVSETQRWVQWQAFLLVSTSVLFLGVISLMFDFHDCAYPSRAFPYFVSGRIISGALLPFMLMYAIALELLAERFQKWFSPVALLACLSLFITVSEFQVRKATFLSPYNFFSLYEARR